MQFRNRQDAGRQLARALLHLKELRPVVLALPRGGVPVGFEIAALLEAPLDVVLVRKIGHPFSRELAIGAIAEGKSQNEVVEELVTGDFRVPRAYLEEEIARQAEEIKRRRALYFKDRRRVEIAGCTAIVVDDGIATGATTGAALRSVRTHGPAKLVLAVPVAPEHALESLRPEVDEVACLASPSDFWAVGQFYADFRPVEDDTVVALLDRAAKMLPQRPSVRQGKRP